MLEAGIGEPEMVEPVVERQAADSDAGAAHVGEVRQAEAAGLMHLSEDDLLLLAVDGAPGPHAPLQRAANAAAQFGMPPQHLLEDGDRANARRRLQHRHHLGVENIGKRVRTPPSPRCLLL
jgi:hypothetical protein